MKFTKNNNPNRKRRSRKTYTETQIEQTTAMFTDKKLGYKIPADTYQNK